MPTEFDAVVRLAVAGLAGLAVGMEREWSGHASGPDARFAGIRTTLLYGLAAGIAGWLLDLGQVAAGAVLMAGLATFAIVAWHRATGYPTAADSDHPVDGTTEVAALAVLALGVVSGLGHVPVAAGVAAVVVLALREKEVIHGFVRRVDETELRAALQFAVLALVILPLLPTGPYGPFDAIRPRELWLVVLIFSGLNFAGHLARRLVGEGRGYAVTGALGGLVSSTAVSLVFSRKSQEEPALGRALALGVVGASIVLLFRLAAVTLVINRAVALALLPYLVAPVVIGTGVVLVAIRQGALAGGKDEPVTSGSPLGLWQAIRLALLFQLAMITVEFVSGRFGESGVSGLAFLLGLTDMDALTFSMARDPAAVGGAAVAARAIAIGLIANTLLKGGVSALLGRGRFRLLAVLGLALLGLATAGVMLFI